MLITILCNATGGKVITVSLVILTYYNCISTKEAAAQCKS